MCWSDAAAAEKPRIAVVGAGQAGARAAFALRQQGWHGRISLIGAETHIPYERPALSKQALFGIPGAAPDVAPVQRYREQGIELLTASRVSAIDTREKTVQICSASGQTRVLGYEKLLLATGGQARKISIPGIAQTRLLTLRSKDDAGKLAALLRPGSKVLVIGGGFTGLEIAAAATQQECRVIVLEQGASLLGRNVPHDMAARIHALHCARAVDIRLCDSVVWGYGNPGHQTLVCRSGKSISADVIVCCAGMIPDVELARNAGLRVNRGVLVDRFLQTSAADVYAIGDVCEFPLHNGATTLFESWENAQSQAQLVAGNMLGAAVGYQPARWFWSDQFDYSLQMLGTLSANLARASRALAGGCLDFYLDAESRVVGACGLAPTAALSRPFLLARKLVESMACCAPDALCNPQMPLKKLLPQAG